MLNKFRLIFQSKGEKRLFLLFGIFNALITNITLQVLLLISPIFLSTIISQFVNLVIGYYLYGEKVFKFNNLNKYIFKKYFFIALILWSLNYTFIQSFFYFGVNKNLTAVLMLPFLVVISYLSQKYYVYKKI
ncbi:hypothetical protein OA957_00245 [Prochlorococcus sp. AH-716-B04]|nr:hypothetical protein [Prochlorococcus sp. AH-716-B04]